LTALTVEANHRIDTLLVGLLLAKHWDSVLDFDWDFG